MTQINLLPWREQVKKTKIQQFVLILSACIIITLAALVFLYFYLEMLVTQQKARNNYLTTTITQAENQLHQLKAKQQAVDLIQAELGFLFALRDSSYQAVRLFDALPRVVPDAVSLSSVKRNGNVTMLEGTAQSALQVTQFMKNINQSPVFKQPELSEISNKKNTTGDERNFQLKVIQQTLSDH
jgi:type IV pilus assembly protein PilN